ncbi:multidrug efflux SMR transporter [Pradoshia sp. D12]|uniref:DMT family transporter n=1 Tax=Bacillaceae TaxID=186817 RepID=UPI00080AD8E6|nr:MULTISPECIES: multidrug efflux SMR transporter [Bacillaceae]OCA82551.1 multidrug resistance protein SMR [Bacillus sp. FJAT-27986]QFK70239.1 multidrug efflux SMR transporter [Pradoshia sp. D12]TPF71019.1 multidrug efflux SMR transporter [Bacillus sp. D12]
MNRHWLKVIIGAFFEIIWVSGLKNADSIWMWLITLAAICISFYMMIDASRYLPVGTVYAVFVGLGTAGTVIAEILFFDEPLKIEKIALILLLLIGVIGLKIVTDEDTSKKEAN